MEIMASSLRWVLASGAEAVVVVAWLGCQMGGLRGAGGGGGEGMYAAD